MIIYSPMSTWKINIIPPPFIFSVHKENCTFWFGMLWLIFLYILMAMCHLYGNFDFVFIMNLLNILNTHTNTPHSHKHTAPTHTAKHTSLWLKGNQKIINYLPIYLSIYLYKLIFHYSPGYNFKIIRMASWNL